MIENKNKNKIFKSKINVRKIKAVLPPTVLQSQLDTFFYRIPMNIDKDKILSLNSNIKIQIICQDHYTFKKTFKNKFYNSTSNFKTYNKNQSSDLLNNFLHKNIFLEYNIKNNDRSGGLILNLPFDVSNFSTRYLDDEGKVASIEKYFINLNSSFSKKLFNLDIRNIRIFILDEKNNVIDESGILECDFRNIKTNQSLVDSKIFYQNYFLNSFSENLTITTPISKMCEVINITSSSIIDFSMFESINVELAYLGDKKVISCYKDNTSFDNSKFTLEENVYSFCFCIAEDYFLGSENFNFKITINLNIKNTVENKSAPKKQKSIALFKEISLSRDKLLPRTCASFFKEKFFAKTIKSLDFKQRVALIDNFTVLNSIEISSDVPDILLEKIKISEIKMNNVNVDNKLYIQKDFTIENLLYFKGKNILELFDNNFLTFYCRTNNREVFFDIKVNFLDNEYRFTSPKVLNNAGYETSVKKLNNLSKNNINISNVSFNTNLNANNPSIFNFNNISLTNLNSYNDLAYSLGYTLNNQGDIQNFLANCIVKIENNTKVKNIDLSINNTNYYFFNELFNMSEFASGTISINNNYTNLNIKTDDYFSISNKNRNEINKNIIDFFLISDEIKSFKKLSKEKSLNIENNIIIKFLPIPKIIAEYRGYNLDNLGNPIDSNLYSDIENLESIKNRLTRELVVYLYTGNQNLNWTKFNKYKSLLMNSNKSSSVKNYAEFFDDIVFQGMNNNDYFRNRFRYDKNEILSLQNIDDIYLNSNVQALSLEENFTKKYYDFSLSNKEFFIESLPFNILFQNTNYLSFNNEYKVREIKIVKSESQGQIKINITNLKNIYSLEQIKESIYHVRCSIHFLMKNENSDISNINTENTDFVKSVFGGSHCISYNSSYVDKYPSSFSNLKNIIDISKIECSVEGDNIYLIIEDDNDELDISKLNYSYFASFFDFCKTHNINYLLKPILRFSISFKVPQSEDFIFGVFNHNIPYVNLADKKISLEKLSKINTLIVT